MARLKLLIVATVLSGCAGVPLTPEASKVQIIRQDSPLLTKCETIKPLNVEIAEIAPAQVIYVKARNTMINRAASEGADALTITSHNLQEGLKNKITLQGVALKCY